MPLLIRPAAENDAPGIARVHVDSWRSTYARVMSADFLANLSVETREANWKRQITNPASQTRIFVAEGEDGSIIGFACGGPEREGNPLFKSELYAIYLLQAFQGQSIGRKLAEAVAGYLLSQNYRTMLIWVLTENPACKFYEALGGIRVQTKTVEIGGAALEEVAYGWEDIGVIVANGNA